MPNILKHILTLTLLAAGTAGATAQRFVNLTAEEVRVDSVLPRFEISRPLCDGFEDSVYTAKILYPEFIDMPAAQAENYKRLCAELPPELPEVVQCVVYDRKRPSLSVSLCPVAYREGRYQLLVSFMIDIKAEARKGAASAKRQPKKTSAAASRYASHSVLATGQWAKIRVSSTGVHRLTESVIRQAGFTDLSKVKIYGYGGNLRNETLGADDLAEHDDLQEVPTCTVGGSRLFYAKGPVSWSGNTASRRTRNPYSDYGCYFITQGDDTPLTVDESAFLDSFYPSADDYHSLYEVDGYAWLQGGRNLFDTKEIAEGASQTVSIGGNANATAGVLSVNVSAGSQSTVQVEFNDSVVGTIRVTMSDSYDAGNEASKTFKIARLASQNEVKLTVISGGTARLDYVSMAWDKPFSAPDLTSASLPEAEYVYNITNQDLHADAQCDMLIIIPTSQKLRSEAERLQAFHEENDGMRVRILPADELYNEFSSGTPDASAYRNYLKMLYDRAENDADLPKYLVLFGDCVWDNRMLTTDCKQLDADDYLLCFESENSFNEIKCYVDDGYFCMLDDGEGAKPLYQDKLDMSVGRFPVTTEEDAEVMVDKVISYAANANAGAWQNTIMFMGDDGNNNEHMTAANSLADMVLSNYPGYNVKKVLWDAYERETSSTGNSYPDVTTVIKKQQADGALIMDYLGHGRTDQISHESVLRLNDFTGFTNTNLPLWITASCDIMPFDGTSSTIGEAAVLNSKGGAVAFFGTTRTVYASYNKTINTNFINHILSLNDGEPITIGEAQRLSKNSVSTNSILGREPINNLQYSLLGDPALKLNIPTKTVVIDSINGAPVSADSPAQVKAGSLMSIAGHIEGADGFNGLMTAIVQDSREQITCRWNDKGEDDAAASPMTYYDRTNTLFSGNDSVRHGRFSFSFAVSKDINYSNDSGLITVYAVSDDHSALAHGVNDDFIVGGSDLGGDDGVGPSIYCYLNSPSFSNGGKVNSTPYFVAQITDKDGINATGGGIGHDLQLVIDGEMSKTYVLNDNFSYDFGSYTKGETYYMIPELDEGWHTLRFRAWDTRNNLSTAELSFEVVNGLSPTIQSVSCTDNPATTSTTFIVNHNFTGSDIDVRIDVFDMSGRLLWTHEETGVSTGSAYTVDWNLTVDGGGRLQTGVYLYRVGLASNGSKYTTKAKKLVIIGNK